MKENRLEFEWKLQRFRFLFFQNFIFIPEIYILGFDSELWDLLTQGLKFRNIFEGLKMKKYRFKKSKSQKRVRRETERIGQVKHFLPHFENVTKPFLYKGYNFKSPNGHHYRHHGHHLTIRAPSLSLRDSSPN